jgi:GDP-L-fucose synthase
MHQSSRIFVAGHRGLVGSSIVRALQSRGYDQLLLRTRQELDLTQQAAVDAFFAEHQLEYVFLCAAKVGGIHANNTYPADFIRENLQVQTNVIDAAYRHGVRKLLFLGSSCIYPKFAPQPIEESSLLTGPLELTNEWYAIAKIAGLKMAQAYRHQYGFNAISAMPTNLYGPGDNFNLDNSHVLPALIRRFHEARERGATGVTLWGTGTPRREFLHVDDAADACIFLMERYENEEIINVGCGEDVSIRELAELVSRNIGFRGRIVFDAGRPDGTPRKLLDVSRLKSLGWNPRVPLADGIAETCRWFVENRATCRC